MPAHPFGNGQEPEDASRLVSVRMRLSGAVRVAVNSAEVTLALPAEAATPARALRALCERYPRSRRYLLDAHDALLPNVRLLHNDVWIDRAAAYDLRLRDGDRLHVLLAVAGG